MGKWEEMVGSRGECERWGRRNGERWRGRGEGLRERVGGDRVKKVRARRVYEKGRRRRGRGE